MFYVLSQDGEKLQGMSGYGLTVAKIARKGNGEPRYFVAADDGLQEMLAEYDTVEDCKAVIKIIAFALRQNKENENYVAEMPQRDEVSEMIKQFEELTGYLKQAGGKVAKEAADLFGELFGE